MVTYDEIRRVTAPLPGAEESPERFGFYVTVKGKEKGFLWLWSERVHPKKPRMINPDVIAVLVRSLTEKDIILGSDSEGRVFFTEPHYNGFPAVLVRLNEAKIEDLEDLIVEAWRCKAMPEMIRRSEA